MFPEPDKNYKYEGDIVDYKGKRYFVSLAEERVEFIGIIKEKIMEGNKTVNTEIEIKHETRLCKVNGKYGIFILWKSSIHVQ